MCGGKILAEHPVYKHILYI